MNDGELKNIWQTDKTIPTIDFAALQKSLNDWQNKLRRKIKIDIAAQIVSLGVVLILVLLYPRLFFIFWFAAALAVWYIRKILVFYRQEKDALEVNARMFLQKRLRAMKSFVSQTRVILYLTPIFVVPAAFYSLGFFNDAATFWERIYSVIISYAAGQILAIIMTEVYLKMFYGTAITDLENLITQFDFDD